MKRILMCAMVVIMSLASFTGCNNLFFKDDGEKFDPAKTLYVGNYNGGLGDAWIQEVANKFMLAYPEYKVVIDNDKEAYNGQVLLSSMSTKRQDIYFTSEVSYRDAVAGGYVADITDVVKEKKEMIGGVATSIEDKMHPNAREFFDYDGKYYAIPFFTAINGIVYDADLFREKNFYFKDGGGFVTSEDDTKASGKDGKPNTYDDGLPATWEQFKSMMQMMKEKSITPLIFTSRLYYKVSFLSSVHASYEGLEDYKLNYSFSGTDKEAAVGKIDITTGYNLQKQSGKLAALTVAKEIVSDANNYHKDSFLSIQSNEEAQSKFLWSIDPEIQSSNKINRVAMLLEGGWWENEARDTFNNMAAVPGKENEWGYGKRSFGYMPFPKFEGTPGVPDSPNTKTTLFSDGNTSVFINNFSTKKDLAKKFLQFSSTNESLATCTKHTGVIRPYDYEIDEATLAEMTPYARSMWNVYNDDNSELVDSYIKSDLRQKAGTTFFNNWNWYCDLGNSNVLLEPFEGFKNNPTVTAQRFFEGGQNLFTKTKWDKEMSKFYPAE